MFIDTKEQPFEDLLHIPEPWYIDRIEFEKKQLDIYVKIQKRGLFTCSNCQTLLPPVQDIPDRNRTRRHINFFQFPCYIHAKHPCTKSGKREKIRRADVPWAIKSKWGFTLDLDKFVECDFVFWHGDTIDLLIYPISWLDHVQAYYLTVYA